MPLRILLIALISSLVSSTILWLYSSQTLFDLEPSLPSCLSRKKSIVEALAFACFSMRLPSLSYPMCLSCSYHLSGMLSPMVLTFSRSSSEESLARSSSPAPTASSSSVPSPASSSSSSSSESSSSLVPSASSSSESSSSMTEDHFLLGLSSSSSPSAPSECLVSSD